MDYSKLQLRELKKITKELEEINKLLGKLTRALQDRKGDGWEWEEIEPLDYRDSNDIDVPIYPVFMESGARDFLDNWYVDDVEGNDCD